MNIHRIYDVLSPMFRQRRMRQFKDTPDPRAGEMLLDIGGTPGFWIKSDLQADITLLNRERPSQMPIDSPRLSFREADACSLPFETKSFDIVFSNSVIEHVGTWERQKAFASEALRVGRRLWVQTPAREFFIEPHLIAPFVHWMPRRAQRLLIRNFTFRGWIDRPDRTEVESFLDEVRLVSMPEMQMLFPDCEIRCERFLGMNKSYIAIRT
jgi:SAM-dependent methyltransferase